MLFFKLGKPSFKKENLLNKCICIRQIPARMQLSYYASLFFCFLVMFAALGIGLLEDSNGLLECYMALKNE